MRLVLHFCDDSKKAEKARIKEGKKHIKCKNSTEIKEYFASHIIGFDVDTDSPTLGHKYGNLDDENLNNSVQNETIGHMYSSIPKG